MPPAKIDISRSLALFLIAYDQEGKAKASSGLLHGETPSPPPGVLEHANKNGENRVTWEPEPGVRIAPVVIPVDEPDRGFVLAGRSLREIEERELQVELEAGAALFATLLTSVVVVFCELVLAAE